MYGHGWASGTLRRPLAHRWSRAGAEDLLARRRKPKTAGIRSDLRAGEHLCAIAFIKRRFVRCFDNVSIDIGGMPVRGSSLKPGMPSAPFMAVVHWLKDAIHQAETDPKIGELYERFHKAAHELADTQPGGGYGEWESDIRCLRVATERRRWRSLDGDLLRYRLKQCQPIRRQGRPADNATIRNRAGEVKRCLHRLQGALGTRPPSPFYAVLLMDGDSLGINLSDPKKQPVITEALDAFTKRVKGIVDEHNGFLVYAGGDDVLALLPLEDAMNCALRLRRCYLAAFDKRMDPRHPFAATISGAIEYAHVRMPLTKVFKDAQELLKHVAKAGRGRDALAVRVWKPGGKALEWALPWGIAFAQGQPVRMAQRWRFRRWRTKLPLTTLTRRLAAGSFTESGSSSTY